MMLPLKCHRKCHRWMSVFLIIAVGFVCSDSASAQNHTRASQVQAKYLLTDDEMILLNHGDLNQWEISLVAELSSISGESIARIIKMHIEQKMTWDKIVYELGIDLKQ